MDTDNPHKKKKELFRYDKENTYSTGIIVHDLNSLLIWEVFPEAIGCKYDKSILGS